jgi:hypothetical protein
VRKAFTFVVEETVVAAPGRVAEAMRIWADCLARRLAASAEAAPDRVGDPAPGREV